MNEGSEDTKYLEDNKRYWEKGYEAPNVDHHMFRFFGRILRPEFSLPKKNERLLDFGCGQGAAVNYFHMNGFNAQGVDISRSDISSAQIRYPHIKNKFSICDINPKIQGDYGTEKNGNYCFSILVLFFERRFQDFNITSV